MKTHKNLTIKVPVDRADLDAATTSLPVALQLRESARRYAAMAIDSYLDELNVLDGHEGVS